MWLGVVVVIIGSRLWPKASLSWLDACRPWSWRPGGLWEWGHPPALTAEVRSKYWHTHVEMTERLFRLIALAGQGRAETNGSRRAGVLFLGCPPVSVGQEAEVGAWLGEDRSAACTEGTGHWRLVEERDYRWWFPHRLVTEHAFEPCPDAQGGGLQHQTIQVGNTRVLAGWSLYKQQSGHGGREAWRPFSRTQCAERL